MMTTTTKTVLLVLTAAIAAATTEAFVARHLMPQSSLKAAAAAKPAAAVVVLQGTTSTTDDDTTLADLQHEYKVLQEKLLADIVIAHDDDDAETVEEQMIEVAAQASAVQIQHQMEEIDEAETELHQAEDWFDGLDREFMELETKHKIEAAKILLQRLKVNESRLAATLAKLKEEKHNEEIHREEASKHRSFLDQVKDAIFSHPDLLINMDPHIL